MYFKSYSSRYDQIKIFKKIKRKRTRYRDLDVLLTPCLLDLTADLCIDRYLIFYYLHILFRPIKITILHLI